jgi:hypothetical protein
MRFASGLMNTSMGLKFRNSFAVFVRAFAYGFLLPVCFGSATRR